MDLKTILNNLDAYVLSDFGLNLLGVGIFLCFACFSRSLFFIALSFAAYVFDITPLFPALTAFCFSVFSCFAECCIGIEEINLNNGQLQKDFTPEFLEKFLLFSKFIHEYFRTRSFLYLMRCYWNFKTARLMSYHYFPRQPIDSSFDKWNLISGSIWAICITGIGYALAACFWKSAFLDKQPDPLFPMILVFLVAMKQLFGNSNRMQNLYLYTLSAKQKTIEAPSAL